MAKNQFALIRYETEKHKADKLILQKDNSAKKYQIVILILLIITLITFSFLWYKKRQQKMELEKQNAIRESKLKTSKKVHDVVANGLYRVMSEMENQPDINRELIIDKIEDLYEKSRDISYDKPDALLQPDQERISGLLSAFVTPATNVVMVGNTPKLWGNLSRAVKYELEQVLQELMVNMKKHSKASTVVIKFEQKQKNIWISYTDDGVGMSENIVFNNGLKNTGNRIDGIGASINFETKLERGLKIQIIVPFS